MNRYFTTMFVFAILFGSAAANVINIPADQPNIQAGIDAAVNGDTVLVAGGTYFENINFKGKAITVASHYFTDGDTSHISNTIIDGSQASDPDSGSVVRFVSGEDTTSVLYGFTITNGTGTLATSKYMGVEYTGKRGGGIFCFNSGGRILFNKIINNTIIETDGNIADGGGIAAALFDTPDVTDVIIEGNQILNNRVTGETASGGGISMVINGKVLDNIISFNYCVGNHWALGCGIFTGAYINDVSNPYPYQVTIENNQITHNSITSKNFIALGGGLTIQTKASVLNNNISFNELSAASTRYAKGAGMFLYLLGVEDMTLINGNTFSHNVITSGNSYGGGLCLQEAKPLITNNIFSFNSSNKYGGGIGFIEGSHAKIINNTVTNNNAYYGGGIYSADSNPVVINTIVWANQAENGPGIRKSSGSINVAYSDIQGGWPGTGNIDVDPLFADTLFHLTDNSFCIGAGIDSIEIGGTLHNCPTNDYEGNIRPNPPGSRPDIGACESPLDLPSGLIMVPEHYPTIQSGIDASKDGDIVLVAENTYYEQINFKGKAITVASHYFADGDTSHISNTIIDGSQASDPDGGSVVSFVSGEDTTSVLYGFTITNGTGTFGTEMWRGEELTGRAGGGIRCFNSGASILFNKIINNTIIDNAVYLPCGGGINASAFDSTYVFDVIIKGNRILNNKVTGNNAQGGGIRIRCNGKVVDNIISFNSCLANNGFADGAGVICYSDPNISNPYQLVIENNTITNNSATSNTAEGYGGGLFISETITFMLNNDIRYNELSAASNKEAYGAGMIMRSVDDNSVVNGNTIAHNVVTKGRGYGGGLYLDESKPLITNNIISFNSAKETYGRGGGICFVEGSHAKIINNTIANNNARYGGGLYSEGSNPVVINTIVWSNQAEMGPGIQRYGGSINVAYSDIQGGWDGVGNIDADPSFADTLFHLADNSPCIGEGIGSIEIDGVLYSCPKTDCDGNPRPDPPESNPDIGAIESPLATDVKYLQHDALPVTYSLEQNHPNPFNPSTTIKYDLPKTAHVQLVVYDLLGRHVRTLVDTRQQAGHFQTTWDGTDERNVPVAAGLYFCRMEAEGFVKVIKLALVR